MLMQLPPRIAGYAETLIETTGKPAAEEAERQHMTAVPAMVAAVAAMAPEQQRVFMAGLSTRLASYVQGLVTERNEAEPADENEDEFLVQVEAEEAAGPAAVTGDEEFAARLEAAAVDEGAVSDGGAEGKAGSAAGDEEFAVCVEAAAEGADGDDQ